MFVIVVQMGFILFLHSEFELHSLTVYVHL